MQIARPVDLLGILAAVASIGAPAIADSVSVGPQKDNTLYETTTGNTSNGAGNFLFAGRNSQATNSIRRGLVAFDFAAIPAGSIINSVSLTLHQDSTNPANATVSLHRLAEGWGEGTSVGLGNGAPATTSDATWLHRSFNSVLWSTPGGAFAAAPSAATVVGGNGFYTWTSPTLVSDVQAFVNNPGSNFGWMLRGDESTAGSAKRFHTREETEPSFRPNLTIDYTLVPAPGVVALGLASASGVFVRRARGKARF